MEKKLKKSQCVCCSAATVGDYVEVVCYSEHPTLVAKYPSGLPICEDCGEDESLSAKDIVAILLDGSAPGQALTCPKCGGDDAIRLLEDVTRYFDIRKSTTRRVVAVADWPPDIDDEGENTRLQCRTCMHEWPLDAAISLEWIDES